MDVSDLKGLTAEVKKRMDAQIEHVRRELSGVRTGRCGEQRNRNQQRAYQSGLHGSAKSM